MLNSAVQVILSTCMFHVTCMGLGRFPCVLHAFYMHVTCMQQSNIGLCFPKVLKLWITCTYISRDEVSVTCDIQNEYLCDIFSILCDFSNMHQASHVPYSRKFSPGENFRLFRPGSSWAKFFFGELVYPVKILSHWNFYTHRFYTWLPSSTILVWYSKLLLSRSAHSVVLPRCILDFARSCGTPVVGAIAFRHHRGQCCCERRAAS